MKKFLFTCLILTSAIASRAQIAEKAEDVSPLLIGETLPNMKVVNSKNDSVDLLTVLTAKPTVLVFYRGGWCPFCNKQLAALGQSEEEIVKAGYQIVAISPENFQNIDSTLMKDHIHYQVFSDPGGKLIQKAGLAFKTSDKYKGYIATKTKGAVSEILPVPTVMIVNTKGEILFEYINPNFKVRMSKELLMAVLPALKNS